MKMLLMELLVRQQSLAWDLSSDHLAVVLSADFRYADHGIKHELGLCSQGHHSNAARRVLPCVDGALAGEPVACWMPCGHVPNLYLTSHPTPGLAVSFRRMSVRSRVMLSRASGRYVLCRGCGVPCVPNGACVSS